MLITNLTAKTSSSHKKLSNKKLFPHQENPKKKKKTEKVKMLPDDTRHHHSLTNYFPSAATNASNNPPSNGDDSSSASVQMAYCQLEARPASAVGPIKRGRGRPRKYGNPSQGYAARTTPPASSSALPGMWPVGGYAAAYLGMPENPWQDLTPHLISVPAGEDVAERITMFMQQSISETCILSASGDISTALISQPAAIGGQISYQGQFVIISLGATCRDEHGGRICRLRVCLSHIDGHTVGGGICGPLIAASDVQVIVGTYTLENRKYAGGNGYRADDYARGSVPSIFHPTGEANQPNGNDEHHRTMGGMPLMNQNQNQGGLYVASSRSMKEEEPIDPVRTQFPD
ncbi:AT-hook motif nuclear-localized protein 14 [Linum grandiflorum]